jgi:hypothetical protein
MGTDYHIVYLQTYIVATAIDGEPGDVRRVAAMALGQNDRTERRPPMTRYQFMLRLREMMSDNAPSSVMP